MVLTESSRKLDIGDKAPNFQLPGIDGRTHELEDYAGRPVLVIFMCNHCPYVKSKFETIKGISERFGNRITVIGINSNEDENYPEDSFENMKKIANEKGFNFVYLRDESQDVAKAYGAVCTPDPFLLDKDLNLVYHGRLNDAMSPDEQPTREEMIEIIENHLNGNRISQEFRPSMGCSIKWK